MTEKTVISKNSKITLGFAVTALTGILWVYGSQATTDAKMDRLEKFEDRQQRINEQLLDRTAEINGKLDVLLEREKNKNK